MMTSLPSAPPKRVGLYLRVSSEQQLEGHSLDAQRRLGKHYAEERGWVVVKIYEDPGLTATTDRRLLSRASVLQRRVVSREAGAAGGAGGIRSGDGGPPSAHRSASQG